MSHTYWRFREVYNYIKYSIKIVKTDLPKNESSEKLLAKLQEAREILISMDKPKR